MEDIDFSFRAELAKEILGGEGTVEDLIEFLAAKVNKTVVLEDIKEEESIERVALRDERLRFLIDEMEEVSLFFSVCGEHRTATEVANSILNVDLFLEGVRSLNNPEFWCLNKDGQLVFGDSSAMVDPESIGLNYNESVQIVNKLVYIWEKNHFLYSNG